MTATNTADNLTQLEPLLLAAMPWGVCALGQHGEIVWANRAAIAMLGYPAASLHERPFASLIANSTPLDLSSAATVQGEFILQRADGECFTASCQILPLHQSIARHALCFRDVSERRAAERLKDEFVSTVSHELRTPLTAIRGALGLLESGVLGAVSDKAANLLRIARSNSDRLFRLINDILDLERLQSGREPLSLRSVELGELVRQAIDSMLPVAEAARIELLNDGSMALLEADPDRLQQVLVNLLSNAIKFSPPGACVSVTVRSGVQGVVLSVIDQGRGIPADKLETVFDRFQQVDRADARQKGGSGLGLAICRGIIAEHGGRIWAERNPIAGCTFRVFLPYRPAVGPAHHEAGSFLLLADADATRRHALAHKLSQHGWQVTEASTVDQTLSAASNAPAAILVETGLDGLGGLALLPLLRRLDPRAATPVLLASLASSRPATWTALATDDNVLIDELARALGRGVQLAVVDNDPQRAVAIGDLVCHPDVTVRAADDSSQLPAALALAHVDVAARLQPRPPALLLHALAASPTLRFADLVSAASVPLDDAAHVLLALAQTQVTG